MLQKIRKQGKQSDSVRPESSPIPHLLEQQAKTDKETQPVTNDNANASSLRLKHSELLKVKRELVLPLHMKHLLEQARFIDDSLNFLKQCRHKGESNGILFTEVRASVAKSFSRTVTEDNFRQLLTVVPDFYTHEWVKGSSTKPYQLAIDFESDTTTFKNLSYFRERQEVLKQRLTDLCVDAYREVMAKVSIVGS